MKYSGKLSLSILLIFIPIILLGNEAENKSLQFSFWDLLFAAKYLVGFILALVTLLFIWKKKLSTKIRTASMIIVFGLFAVFFSLHPSPICAFTKPFSYGLRLPFLAGIAFIGVLSIISTKGYCGTICPAGALQELFYKLPYFKKIKSKKIPFKISNSIRTIVFALFFIGLFGLGFSIFSYFNLFELFHWNFDMPLLNLSVFILSLVIILGASLILYRPFCYYICPVGWISWVLEQIAVTKIHLKHDNCTDCGICEVKAPCTTVSDLMEKKKIRSDCHLCGVCLNVCPEDAFYFGIKNRN